MTFEDHQRLLNSLAKAMENQGITITHVDIDETPEYFDEKYRKSPIQKKETGVNPIWRK